MYQKGLSTENIKSELLFSQIMLGNTRAFTEVYYQYNKLLYVVAYKYLMDDEMSKDVVQHVFCKLWESRKELSVNVSLKNYLITMAKNHILNVIRNQNTALQKNYEIAQCAEMIDDSFMKRMDESEMHSELYRAIHQLPQNKKAICLLKLNDELSNKEIADQMNLSINTVKTHYSESLKILRKLLSQTIIILIVITLLILTSV